MEKSFVECIYTWRLELLALAESPADLRPSHFLAVLLLSTLTK